MYIAPTSFHIKKVSPYPFSRIYLLWLRSPTEEKLLNGFSKSNISAVFLQVVEIFV